jgi:hypothetical protein
MSQMVSSTATAACAYTRRWRDGTRPISDALLEVFARRFFRDLRHHSSTIDRFSRGTGSMLVSALSGYELSFRDTGSDHCVDVDNLERSITFNRNFFDEIAARALTRELRYAMTDGAALRGVLRSSVRSTVRMVMAHEMFHPTQGLPTISVVRQAAKAVGWDEVAKLDVDADFRAAAVEASLSAIENKGLSFREVLAHFEDALAFQLRYCVPLFGSPPDKPHKRSRVAGLVMQLARIVYALRTGGPIDDVTFRSLTMPVYVRVNEDHSSIGMFGLDPIMFLGSMEFDKGELTAFFDALDSGEVEWLVQEAMTISLRIGLLAV